MTITIMLTRGYSTVVDDVDKDLAHLKWHAHKSFVGTIRPRHSQYTPGSGVHHIFLSRVIFERMIGRSLLHGEEVDHQDLDALNNRRENLRPATRSQNKANVPMNKNNKSGFKGVSYSSSTGKWQAGIQVRGQKIHLGVFTTPEEAHDAYCAAAKKYFGEFARGSKVQS